MAAATMVHCVLSIDVCFVRDLYVKLKIWKFPIFVAGSRVDKHQRMSTDMLVRHHSATSALVSNLRFFTWAKR